MFNTFINNVLDHDKLHLLVQKHDIAIDPMRELMLHVIFVISLLSRCFLVLYKMVIRIIKHISNFKNC